MSNALLMILKKDPIDYNEFLRVINELKGDALREALSTRDTGNQSILDWAMKDDTIFGICCEKIIQFDRLLLQLITQNNNAWQETVVHQLFEFGRIESLKILHQYAIENPYIRNAINEAIQTQNIYQETPLQFLNKRSKTMANLYNDESAARLRKNEIQQKLKPMIRFYIIEQELMRLKDNIDDMQDTPFKTAATALLEKIDGVWKTKSIDNINGFFQFCTRETQRAKPDLDKETIGWFQRLINCIAAHVFKCRLEQYTIGTQQQNFFKTLEKDLFAVNKNRQLSLG